ncbi:MAG: hypothetical protein K1Y02_26630 [Candidatus Hydrogenedentes bacterium]|nr:hypothetical protein [Candidatus Hydrogenedentota bacterium]
MRTSVLLGAAVAMLMTGGLACSAAPEESLGEDQGAAGGGGSCVAATSAMLAQAFTVTAGGEDVFQTSVLFTPLDNKYPPYMVPVTLRVKGTPGDTTPLFGASAGCVEVNGIQLGGTISRARFEVMQAPIGLPPGSFDVHDALEARNALYTNIFGNNSWSIPSGTVMPPLLWAIDPLCPAGTSAKTKVFNHAGVIKRRAANAGYTTVPNGYIVPTNVQPPASVPLSNDGSEVASFTECAGG